MARVQRIDPATEWSDVALLFTDDAGIAAVNRRVFGRHSPTDVISLRYEAAPLEPTGCTAEVIVNVARAWDEGMRRATRRGGWDPNRELALYLAHGCDHLSGADDARPPERQRMRRRELRWVREERAAGRVEGLFGQGGAREGQGG